ncbi:MAG: Fic family protein [Patescibacteria group bacterium]|jgi:death-on-curing family protein
MIKKISIEAVKYTAHTLAKETLNWDEPIPEFDTRYPNVLESCINTPFQTYGGKDLYQGLISKAAILFYLLIKNHPFQNGNKRIAITSLFLFLYINQKWLKVDSAKLYNFAVWVAQSPTEAKEEVINYISKFIKQNIINATNNFN